MKNSDKKFRKNENSGKNKKEFQHKVGGVEEGENLQIFEKGVKRKKTEELDNKAETQNVRKIQKLILELNHKSSNKAPKSNGKESEIKLTEKIRKIKIVGNLDHLMKESGANNKGFWGGKFC